MYTIKFCQLKICAQCRLFPHLQFTTHTYTNAECLRIVMLEHDYASNYALKFLQKCVMKRKKIYIFKQRNGASRVDNKVKINEKSMWFWTIFTYKQHKFSCFFNCKLYVMHFALRSCSFCYDAMFSERCYYSQALKCWYRTKSCANIYEQSPFMLRNHLTP